jgi:hypothetical protein
MAGSAWQSEILRTSRPGWERGKRGLRSQHPLQEHAFNDWKASQHPILKRFHRLPIVPWLGTMALWDTYPNHKQMHGTQNRDSKLCYFFIVLLSMGTLLHLQRFLQCIKYITLEFTPPTALLHPPQIKLCNFKSWGFLDTLFHLDLITVLQDSSYAALSLFGGSGGWTQGL